MEYNGMNKRKKKTWQWEVVATQAYLKNMNALFITHGQSIIIYGSEVAPESNSMICRAKTDWHGGPVGASTPKCKVQPTNNMEKKQHLCVVWLGVVRFLALNGEPLGGSPQNHGNQNCQILGFSYPVVEPQGMTRRYQDEWRSQKPLYLKNIAWVNRPDRDREEQVMR